MKLYQVPRNTQVRVTHDIQAAGLKTGDIILFGHIDGMHSYCKNPEGHVIHLIATLEVEMIGSAN